MVQRLRKGQPLRLNSPGHRHHGMIVRVYSWRRRADGVVMVEYGRTDVSMTKYGTWYIGSDKLEEVA